MKIDSTGKIHLFSDDALQVVESLGSSVVPAAGTKRPAESADGADDKKAKHDAVSENAAEAKTDAELAHELFG